MKISELLGDIIRDDLGNVWDFENFCSHHLLECYFCTGGVLEVTSITDTEVWSFGQGSKGQLGHGDRLDRSVGQCE